MFESILTRPATNLPVSLLTYLMVFAEALILSLIVHKVYRYRKSHLSETHSFTTVMILMAPTVATIMLFIGSNLALSIGLIGSLSIIRFRTVIKDPLDLMYLFLLIGIGLGCGTQNFVLAAVATVLLAGTLLFIHPKEKYSEGILIIARDSDDKKLVSLGEELKKVEPSMVQERVNLGRQMSETVWSSNKDLKDIDRLLSEFKNRFDIEAVSYMKKMRD